MGRKESKKEKLLGSHFYLQCTQGHIFMKPRKYYLMPLGTLIGSETLARKYILTGMFSQLWIFIMILIEFNFSHVRIDVLFFTDLEALSK